MWHHPGAVVGILNSFHTLSTTLCFCAVGKKQPVCTMCSWNIWSLCWSRWKQGKLVERVGHSCLLFEDHATLSKSTSSLQISTCCWMCWWHIMPNNRLNGKDKPLAILKCLHGFLYLNTLHSGVLDWPSSNLLLRHVQKNWSLQHALLLSSVC